MKTRQKDAKLSTEQSVRIAAKELLKQLGSIKPREGAYCLSPDGSMAVEFVAWRRGQSNLCDLDVRLLPRALPSDIPNSVVEEWQRFYEEESKRPLASSKEAAVSALEALKLPRVRLSDLAATRLLLTQVREPLRSPETSPAKVASRMEGGSKIEPQGHTDRLSSQAPGRLNIGPLCSRTSGDPRLPSKPLPSPPRLSVRIAALDENGRGTFRSVLFDVPVRVTLGALFFLKPLRKEPEEPYLPSGRLTEVPGQRPVGRRGIVPPNMPAAPNETAEETVVEAEPVGFAAYSLPSASGGPTEFICEEVQEEFTARVERSPDGTLSLNFTLFEVPAEREFTRACLFCTYRNEEDTPLAAAEAELLPPDRNDKNWRVNTIIRWIEQAGTTHADATAVKKSMGAARPSFVIQPLA